MNRTIILATVLCLAVAALGVGAAPALAADGCTCHTVEPPTATAAHAPLLAAVTACTTCHKGMTVPHPALVEPTLTLTTGVIPVINHHTALVGLFLPFKPLRGVTVYMQGKAADATGYTDLSQGMTNRDGQVYLDTVPLPVPEGMTFRAISQGRAGPPVVKPAFSVPPVEPPATSAVLRLRGLTNYRLRLGRTVTFKATCTPKALVGQKAHFAVSKRIKGDWEWQRSYARTINAAGVMTCKFRPRTRGLYSVIAGLGGTAAYQGFQTDAKRFRVK